MAREARPSANEKKTNHPAGESVPFQSDEEQTTDRDDLTMAWAVPVQDVLAAAGAEAEMGLSPAQVRRRRKQFGANRLRKATRRPWWGIFIEQVRSVVVLILSAACVLSFALGNIPEGVAVAAVIVINTGIGFLSEWRATRSMEALRQIGSQRARVMRDGRDRDLPVDQIVPGDIILLDAGDIAPADLRLVEANGLMVDESALTGESLAQVKQTDAVDIEAPLAERACMLFRGTTVTEGSARGVVVATGMDTELGRIAELAEGVQEELTPLEKRLERLGRRMAWGVLAAAALIAAAGAWAGHPLDVIIVTSVALGVAAVPEGMPIVANLALARGMWLMAKRHALINRLPAVETLGATDVIFTDKTGTLTENRMTLKKLLLEPGQRVFRQDQAEPDDGQDEHAARLIRRALEIGVLCSNASLSNDTDDEKDAQGDPTEIALLRAGAAMEMNRPELLKQRPETREVSFDPDRMMMATFHRLDDQFEVAVKGAPGAVLDVCITIAEDVDRERELTDEDRRRWRDKTDELAAEGLRVLAVADKNASDDQAEPYEDLRFVGLLGLYDPPREGVSELIGSCRTAGISVVMVTGDQAQTARAIGHQVGIAEEEDNDVLEGGELDSLEEMGDSEKRRALETRIFARFSPEQKLTLVDVYQSAHHVVAMTGDGINDAPALKKADIGVAMGHRGTDAAREASDMVLQDDAFSSIVAAIAQGRVIFGNIRKSVSFMFCTNVAEVLAVAAASVTGLPLPLLPLQILYLNMLTDVFPALALGVGKGGQHTMKQPPRNPNEPIMTARHWIAVGGWGLLIAGCTLAALGGGLTWFGGDEPTAVTASFLTLGFAKLWFVYNLRETHSHWLQNSILQNRWIWAASGLCIVLLVAAVHLPGLASLLRTRPPGLTGWPMILGLSFVPVLVDQIRRAVWHRDA